MSFIQKKEQVYCCLVCLSPLVVGNEEFYDTRFGIATPYRIGRCDHCHLEQTVPLPTIDNLKFLYEKYYNFGGETNTVESSYVRLRKFLQNSHLWNLWLSIDGDISFHSLRGEGRLLDVGCNEGRGLIQYKKSGFLPEGLELNDKAANVARRKGFIVHSNLIEIFEPECKYDVVVLSNVLEHSLNPSEMLSHVSRILNRDGQVWISCPNSQSWLRFLFGRFWINWHVPFHISHFSQKALASLLRNNGFNVIKAKQITPALWVSHSILAWLFSKPGIPTNRLRSTAVVACLMLLIRVLGFPLLWLGNRVDKGDCLLFIAKKNG